MLKWFDESVPCLDACVLTMGNFDGLHLGHRKVLSILHEKAKELGLPAVVLTYWEHPGHYVHLKHQVPILTPRPLKKELIRACGSSQVYFINFTTETAHVTALTFLKEVLIEHFHPRLIVAGYDSHFGYRREGNADFLSRYGVEFGYDTIRVEPVYQDTNIISSTLIRDALQQGDVRTAAAMLGEPYCLYGTVSHGKKLGRSIGFPTVNLNPIDNEQLIPANGVYLSAVSFNQDHYFGLTNIGVSPTLKNNGQIEIETFILDFDREMYGENIRLEMLEFIRSEEHFPTVHALKRAIEQDIRKGKELLAGL